MEEPKKDESSNLIDTSVKKADATDEEKKNSSNQDKLILEMKDDEEYEEEEDEEINNILAEDDNTKEEKKAKHDEDEDDEEIKEEENENANLNYDRHFDRELIVGKDYEFKTIQSAINEAKPNNIIKISPGIYRENITIKNKTKIDICSLDNNDQAIILSENSPGMMIYC